MVNTRETKEWGHKSKEAQNKKRNATNYQVILNLWLLSLSYAWVWLMICRYEHGYRRNATVLYVYYKNRSNFLDCDIASLLSRGHGTALYIIVNKL